MAAKTFTMTAAGKAELEAELEQLKTEGRVDIAEKLKVARSYGDLSENSEYDEAYQLENAVIVDSSASDKVSMGSKVTVLRKTDNQGFVYEIVGFSQSNPSAGKISDESPVGKALLGASVGETVVVEAPIGNLEFEIKSID